MKVLVFGKTPGIMTRALETLGAAAIDAEGAFSVIEAEARLRHGGIALLAMGGGVPKPERVALKALAEETGIVTVDVFGPETLIPTVKAAMID